MAGEEIGVHIGNGENVKSDRASASTDCFAQPLRVNGFAARYPLIRCPIR
jgi:hypothetical protein